MNDLCDHMLLRVSCDYCRPRTAATATTTTSRPRPPARARAPVQGARKPRTPEQAARRLFRQQDFHVEAVPWIRARNDAFMAIVCRPATDTAGVVELLTRPENTTLAITHIHIGRPHPAYPDGPPSAHTVRVYIAWDKP